MRVAITTLSENTAVYGFLAEWGISMLIEADGVRLLMDTGLSHSAVHNAQLLRKDLSAVDCIVLSHGHGDHTGGLREVLKRTGEVRVIAHPDIWSAKYGRGDTGKDTYIGMPFSRQDLESLGARFDLKRGPVHITDRIMTTGEITMSSEYEQIDEKLLVKEDGSLGQDTLADDLAVIIDTDFGLVVVLGCGHRGIVNTLRHARELTGGKSIYAAIGGTHLIKASKERMAQTVADLKAMGIKKLGASHCTGFYASAQLAQEFGEVFFLNNAGTHIELPVEIDVSTPPHS